MAVSDPFIDQDDLSAALGRDVTNDDGALMAVDAACDICRTVCEQTINKVSNETIRLDGTGTDALLLPQVPVTAVSEVSVYDSEGALTTAGTADYVLNRDGVLFATNTAGTSTWGSVWPDGRQNIQVKYTHGYADADIPRDLRAVALTVASRLYLQGPKSSESFGDVSVSWSAESTALMPTERLILHKYRRRHGW